jgi:16S rRNA (uracil1498-N3)-methyltransferase
MPVYFIHSTQVEDETITVTGPLFSHLSKSLRTKPGDSLIFNDERGRRYFTIVLHIAKHLIQSKILDVQDPPAPFTPAITLAQALLKGEKMGWVIQKATELGVQTLAPLMTERVIPRVSPLHSHSHQKRWQRIALEAAQQSERWHLPNILPLQGMEEFLRREQKGLTIFLIERQKKPSLSKIPLPLNVQNDIAVIIGPEGGWTQKEVQTAEAQNCSLVTLGQNILRAETASLAALVILQSRLQCL